MSEDVKNEGAAPSVAAEVTKQFAAGKLTADIGRQFLEGATGKEQPKPADTATADAQKKTVTSENAAAPESAKETQQDKGSRRKPEAEARIADLIAENKKLQEQLKARPTETRTAEPSTAKADTKQPEAKREAPQKPVRPKMEDFEASEDGYKKYDAADRKYFDDLDKYQDEVRAWDREETIRKFKEESQREVAQQQFNQYLAEAEKRYPGLKEVLPAFAKELGEVHPVVSDMLQTSDMLADVLMVIAGDPEAKAEFLQEAKSNPAKALRRIAITEKLVHDKLSADKGEPAKKTEPEVKKNPAEKKTEEPQPTREVGNRGTGPANPTADAVRRSDGKLTKELSDRWMREAAGS